MPWLHLYIDTNGMVKACCNANITFGNINTQSVEEIWNGEPIRQFRRLMLEGRKDRRCATCFQKEEAGKSSMRLETLEKFDHKLDWVGQTHESGFSKNSKPIYFDIRFNNLCNLRCRTCWHGASSSWFEEAKLLNTNLGQQAIIQATTDNMSLIGQLLKNPNEIEEIYFAGGEPLMMNEHYEVLDQLIQTSCTSVHLSYNTNLSTLKLKSRSVLDLWEKFEHLTISVSIDGLHDQAEYIRKGLKWDLFIDNMSTIKARLPHAKLEIAPTISVFNIIGLGDLHQYFVNEGLIGADSIYLNVLSRPDYYNIKILTESLKHQAEANIRRHLEWLKPLSISENLISEFESVIQYMNHEDWSKKITQLKTHIQTLDQMRSEQFKVVFPALNSLFDPF
ncbi:MAG: twitch domain-containing radical SAM protein [Reichenbachiella sp.]|uniref:twitch domain-containing radical SAM protein n=1 Tax=Reichenbachiella sp. TaxID=2184521 RepID=UPI003267D758